MLARNKTITQSLVRTIVVQREKKRMIEIPIHEKDNKFEAIIPSLAEQHGSTIGSIIEGKIS